MSCLASAVHWRIITSPEQGTSAEGSCRSDWLVGRSVGGCLAGGPHSLWWHWTLGCGPGPCNEARVCQGGSQHASWSLLTEFLPWLPSVLNCDLEVEIEPFLPWTVLVSVSLQQQGEATTTTALAGKLTGLLLLQTHLGFSSFFTFKNMFWDYFTFWNCTECIAQFGVNYCVK